MNAKGKKLHKEINEMKSDIEKIYHQALINREKWINSQKDLEKEKKDWREQNKKDSKKNLLNEGIEGDETKMNKDAKNTSDVSK